MTAQMEHANITVSDARRTAEWMCKLFGWHVRWQGPAKDGGLSLHAGNDTQYVALYQPARPVQTSDDSYTKQGGLNHLGVVVENIEAAERAVVDLGFMPENHADYEPGKRFYFRDHDGIEFEIVQYE